MSTQLGCVLKKLWTQLGYVEKIADATRMCHEKITIAIRMRLAI